MDVPAPDLPSLVERLRDALRGESGLRLAVLFGSHAKGTAHPESDIDLGVLPFDRTMPLAVELDLAATLSRALGVEVDVVRLDGDDLLLGREVARDGVAVLEREPGAFTRYRGEATSAWLDFDEALAPARARFLERLRDEASIPD